jgi:hypothetical protein
MPRSITRQSHRHCGRVNPRVFKGCPRTDAALSAAAGAAREVLGRLLKMNQKIRLVVARSRGNAGRSLESVFSQCHSLYGDCQVVSVMQGRLEAIIYDGTESLFLVLSGEGAEKGE